MGYPGDTKGLCSKVQEVHQLVYHMLEDGPHAVCHTSYRRAIAQANRMLDTTLARLHRIYFQCLLQPKLHLLSTPQDTILYSCIGMMLHHHTIAMQKEPALYAF